METFAIAIALSRNGTRPYYACIVAICCSINRMSFLIRYIFFSIRKGYSWSMRDSSHNCAVDDNSTNNNNNYKSTIRNNNNNNIVTEQGHPLYILDSAIETREHISMRALHALSFYSVFFFISQKAESTFQLYSVFFLFCSILFEIRKAESSWGMQ